MKASAIEFRDVSVVYDAAAARAVDAVSLSVGVGEFVALVGASGSGKTSLLKTVNRLHDAAEGAVLIDGAAAGEADAPRLRRSIGYVFQGVGLFPHLTVGENIAITPRLLGWSVSERAARVRELLDLVELPQDFAARRPWQLSGGQQQRVGIARALAARPKILLMDEPFGALDPLTRGTLGAACRRLHETQGLTTIMVTHDMQEAMLLADRIVVMRQGRIVADGAPADLLAARHEADVAAMLDMPRRNAQRLAALFGRGQAAS